MTTIAAKILDLVSWETNNKRYTRSSAAEICETTYYGMNISLKIKTLKVADPRLARIAGFHCVSVIPAAGTAGCIPFRLPPFQYAVTCNHPYHSIALCQPSVCSQVIDPFNRQIGTRRPGADICRQEKLRATINHVNNHTAAEKRRRR